MSEKEKYTSKFISHFDILESGLDDADSHPIHKVRKEALDNFKYLGFPGKRDEEWRFTDISPILENDFKPLLYPEITKISKDDIDQLTFKDESVLRLVFVDGFFSETLSDKRVSKKDVIITNIKRLLSQDAAEMVDLLKKYKNYENDSFTALNSAFIKDGAVIKIDKNVNYEKPVHLVFISTGHDKPQVTHPKNLVFVDENSNFTLIESYVSLSEDQYFTNAVSEIRVAENAQVDHYRLQNESMNAYHIGNIFIHQQNNSRYISTSLTFGASISRTNINTDLDGQGIETHLNGLYMGHDNQLIDTHTYINHAKPHCESHEIYQGILSEQAKGVFSGKIHVRPDAQKTDAKQSNNCLLLSDTARIDSKPQLEIYADDVKCTHGATIGQLDENAVFYLQSRGISQQRARNILTYAFAESAIENIKIESFRDKVDAIILQRFKEDMNFIK